MKKRVTVLLLLAIVASSLIYSISSRPYYESDRLFGTEVSVKFYGNYFAGQRASKAIFIWLKKLHDTVNIFDLQSEISKLNASASESEFICSDLLWDVLQACRYGYEVSEGYFDITSGA
ncbi:MAG: FAD:protein FMN transferase, partial [Lentisphaeria bacterium]